MNLQSYDELQEEYIKLIFERDYLFRNFDRLIEMRITTVLFAKAQLLLTKVPLVDI